MSGIMKIIKEHPKMIVIMLHVHQESWDHGYHFHSQIRMVFFGYRFSRTLVMTFLEHPLQLNVLFHPHHRWCIDPTSSVSRGAACLLEYTLASAYRARLRSASWLKFWFHLFHVEGRMGRIEWKPGVEGGVKPK